MKKNKEIHRAISIISTAICLLLTYLILTSDKVRTVPTIAGTNRHIVSSSKTTTTRTALETDKQQDPDPINIVRTFSKEYICPVSDNYVETRCKIYQVPKRLLYAIMIVESDMNPYNICGIDEPAVEHYNNDHEIKVFNYNVSAEESIEVCLYTLMECYEFYGNWYDAVAGYCDGCYSHEKRTKNHYSELVMEVVNELV